CPATASVRPKGPASASRRPKAAALASRSRGSIDPALLSTGWPLAPWPMAGGFHLIVGLCLFSSPAPSSFVQKLGGSQTTHITPFGDCISIPANHTIGDDYFGSDCVGVYWPDACRARARQVDNSG